MPEQPPSRTVTTTTDTSEEEADKKPTTMAYNQQDNRNPNRLHLNFGGNFNGNPQTFSAENARAYPTTPSTFPQPIAGTNGQQEVWGAQTPQQGMNSQGYFNSFNPYGNQFQQNLPSPGPGTGYRSANAGFNEVTNGFAQQMNLGGNTPRSASPYGRGPSPANPQRPRTAGNGQQQHGSYLGAPSMPAQSSIFDDEAPKRNGEKYPAAISERVRHQKLLTGEFFKENVERAKARNERCILANRLPREARRLTTCRASQLAELVQSQELSDARKEQKKNGAQKMEANFLRFLRTHERPQNYQTLKIIGKGAFGEVKLVQRRRDGKIYALKSLIKAEMVCFISDGRIFI